MQRFESELLNLLPRLRRFARSLTMDVTEADDLCQLAIEKALKSRLQWQDGTRVDSWMYMIMRNCWVDEQRSKGRRANLFAPLDEAMTAHPNAGSVHRDPLQKLHIHEAMNALPIEQREVAALVWVEGLSYREASDLLAIPMGTLTSRLFRARRTLTKSLEVE